MMAPPIASSVLGYTIAASWFVAHIVATRGLQRPTGIDHITGMLQYALT